MNEIARRSMRHAVRDPLLAWLALLLLLGGTIVLAYIPLAPFNLAISLAVAAAKVAVIAAIFMEWRTAIGIQRLAGVVGFLWLLIFFMLMFADYVSR